MTQRKSPGTGQAGEPTLDPGCLPEMRRRGWGEKEDREATVCGTVSERSRLHVLTAEFAHSGGGSVPAMTTVPAVPTDQSRKFQNSCGSAMEKLACI